MMIQNIYTLYTYIQGAWYIVNTHPISKEIRINLYTWWLKMCIFCLHIHFIYIYIQGMWYISNTHPISQEIRINLYTWWLKICILCIHIYCVYIYTGYVIYRHHTPNRLILIAGLTKKNNNKGALCSLIMEFWYKLLISWGSSSNLTHDLFERPPTRLVGKIWSQSQST